MRLLIPSAISEVIWSWYGGFWRALSADFASLKISVGLLSESSNRWWINCMTALIDCIIYKIRKELQLDKPAQYLSRDMKLKSC